MRQLNCLATVVSDPQRDCGLIACEKKAGGKESNLYVLLLSFLSSSLKRVGLVFSFLGEDFVLWGLLEEMDYYLMIWRAMSGGGRS